MGRYAGRFVVDTHCHGQRAILKFKERGLKDPSTAQMYADVSRVTWVDNSDRLLYDMERYGFDMCILMSGGLARGMDNDLDAKIAERYPDKFAVLCYPTTILNKASRGEVTWTFEGALKETEKRLKTGKYKGMGQGLPVTEMTSFGKLWAKGDQKKKTETLSIEEELDRCRAFMDLAMKYEVAVAGLPFGSPHEIDLTQKLASEYPGVPVVLQLVGWGRRASRAKMEAVCEMSTVSPNIYRVI
jgi:hypothetical protein